MDEKTCTYICKKFLNKDDIPYCINCGRTQREITEDYKQEQELSNPEYMNDIQAANGGITQTPIE